MDGIIFRVRLWIYDQTTPALAFALRVLSASTAVAQTQFPATAAGTQFSGWLAALNSHDRATFLAFLQKNYPDRVARVDDTLAFAARTGGFDVIKVEDCSELTCKVLLQEKNSDQFAEATAEVDPAPPHVLKKISIEAIPRPAGYAIPRMTEAAAVAALRARLEKAAGSGSVFGTALVAQGWQAHLHRRVRDVQTAKNRFPTRSTRSSASGSMNKMFTATAIVAAGSGRKAETRRAP